MTITTAHLLKAVRDDQIKQARAITTLTKILEFTLVLLICWAGYLYDAGISRGPWFVATLVATFVVLSWALCALPTDPSALITDIGPDTVESSGPPEEQPPQ